MKTCLRYGLAGLLAGVLGIQAQDAPPAARKSAAKTKPSAVRAGAVVVSEIGGPVKLKELEGIPTAIKRPLPSLDRADRILSPEATLQYRLDHSRYGGMIGEALVVERPWDLFNPFAPASLGDGSRNLRHNPFTGEAEGVIFFSFRLPEHGSAKSVAHQAEKRKAAAANASASGKPVAPPPAVPPKS